MTGKFIVGGKEHILWNGIEIKVYPDLCFPSIRVRAKRHHKRRIDKKWLKRYGYKNIPVNQAYFVKDMNVIICSKDFYERIEGEI